MATYTSNLNLYMPDPTDDFGEFREEHNDNMVKIDNAIGGGGGSGGHTIIDQSGNSMPNRTGLQFIGASVTDDSVNNKTVVTVTGGGGGVHYSTTEQVIGTYLGKPLYQKTYSGLSVVCATQGTWYSTGQNYDNIEKIVDSVVADQYGQNIKASVGYMSLSPRPIALNCPLDNRTITEFTIWYTKTTD